MSNEWDPYAAEWDRDPAVQAYARLAYDSLRATVDPAGLRVLDFGCGTGSLTERLCPAAAQIVALDASPGMTDILAQKALADVTVLTGELSADWAARQPALAPPFDLIVASSVCSFLADYAGTLAQLHGLLSPGGLFVQWDWLASDESATMGLTPARVEAALQQQGFEAVEVRRAFEMDSPNGRQPVLMAVARRAAG